MGGSSQAWLGDGVGDWRRKLCWVAHGASGYVERKLTWIGGGCVGQRVGLNCKRCVGGSGDRVCRAGAGVVGGSSVGCG